MLVLRIGLTLILAGICIATDDVDPMRFLHQFGYIKSGKYSPMQFTNAVKDFQDMAQLQQTGVLDNDTVTAMKMPRCGLPDRGGNTKYYSRKWKKTSLTYWYSKMTSDLETSFVKKIIRHAFQVWSDVTPLKFTEAWDNKANFKIGFHKRYHLDGAPFDGPGRVLAHAYFPQDGRIHFDDDERWIDAKSQSRGNSMNLFYTAAHEIGHAIGLSHVRSRKALMYPYHVYFGERNGWKLPPIDTAAIQRLYGKNPGTGTGTGSGSGSGTGSGIGSGSGSGSGNGSGNGSGSGSGSGKGSGTGNIKCRDLLHASTCKRYAKPWECRGGYIRQVCYKSCTKCTS